MRRAQAVLWPHYLLAYFEMFARDWERFGEARRRANVLPLGSGALAGSGFPFDREAIARDLGFDGITRNSMDVSADRDFALDFLYAASVAMLHLSRLAEDWILYSSEEFGWLELGDGVTSGSSLMPQKKNPDSLELIRGKCGRVMGCLTSLHGHHEGPAHDLQSRHAGGQGAAVRGRRPVGRLARNGARGGRVGEAATRRGPPPRPRKAGWWPPTWPKRWRAPARRSTRRTRSSAGSCWKACAAARSRPIGRPKRCSAFAPEFTRRDGARCSIPGEGMKSREIPGGTGPEAVAAALAEAQAAARARWTYDQNLSAGPDPEADPRQDDLHAGRAGAGAEARRASPPPR